MNFDETKHKRDSDGKFTNEDGESDADNVKEQIAWAHKNGKDLPLNNDGSLNDMALKKMYDEREDSDKPSRDMHDLPQKTQRVKVAEITSPIYDDMVLSNGRKVKDIVTRAVEMPLTGSAGAEHIEDHPERKGMVEKYKGFMGDIINDPDYVFEDKMHENTLQIEKKIDAHTIMVVKLNYENPEHTNSVITMRNEGENSFERTLKSYEKSKKVLYKKQKS